MVKVGVVDYGVGNVGSVINALRRANADVVVVNDKASIRSVDALILPGVGSFDAAMARLGGIRDSLDEVRGTIPILGICLGLQIMFRGSDEGSLGGLAWYDGWVNAIKGPRVPHIGWDYVKLLQDCPIGVREGYYYFMHSYAVVNPKANKPFVGFTRYGSDLILSVLCDEDRLTFGTQFHPEKSGRLGLGVIRGFVELTRR